MRSLCVADLLGSRPLLSIGGGFTVAAACHRLRDTGVGALAVLDGGVLIGVFNERDVSIRVIARHHDPMLTLVREVMTRDPRTVAAEASVAEALSLMRAGGFRHLPVMRGDAVIGMLSLRDIPPVPCPAHLPRQAPAIPVLG